MLLHGLGAPRHSRRGKIDLSPAIRAIAEESFPEETWERRTCDETETVYRRADCRGAARA